MTLLSKSALALSIAAMGAITLPSAALAQSSPDTRSDTSPDTMSDSGANKSAEQGTDSLTDESASVAVPPANHNTSRSNKRHGGIVGDQGTGGDDSADGDGTRATDYNSSRSNKNFAAPADLDSSDSDGSGGASANGTRATDYNSSRSNKADSASVASEDELVAVDGDNKKVTRNPQTGKEIKTPE